MLKSRCKLFSIQARDKIFCFFSDTKTEMNDVFNSKVKIRVFYVSPEPTIQSLDCMPCILKSTNEMESWLHCAKYPFEAVKYLLRPHTGCEIFELISDFKWTSCLCMIPFQFFMLKKLCTQRTARRRSFSYSPPVLWYFFPFAWNEPSNFVPANLFYGLSIVIIQEVCSMSDFYYAPLDSKKTKCNQRT